MRLDAEAAYWRAQVQANLDSYMWQKLLIAAGVGGAVFLGACALIPGCIEVAATAAIAGGNSAQEKMSGAQAGNTVSKINITERGLEHVLERHVVDGVLSAGKSVFYDNVTITRLIADADVVAPITQQNGNLAYVVDAGRMIGTGRATGMATSIYTVITKTSGELVTAFPGMP
ncbi:MAG: hypothetical protein ACRDYV_00420 [Acidimicrobiia bacterium]